MNKVRVLTYCLILLMPLMSFGQAASFSLKGLTEKKQRAIIDEGNAFYEEAKYDSAQARYEQAAKLNASSTASKFNKGDVYYQRGEYDKAIEEFNAAASLTGNKEVKAKAYHNIGNSYMKTNKYKEAVDAYKNALRNNPNDIDTRYNLAYAQRKLKKQQEQEEENENKNDQENKEQNKDNQGQDNEEGKGDNDKQNKQEGDNKDQEGQENQGDGDNKEEGDKGENEKGEGDEKDENKEGEKGKQPGEDEERKPGDESNNANQPGEGDANQQIGGQISRQDAVRLLEAIENQEDKVQEKVKAYKLKQGDKNTPQKIEKDW